MQILRLANEDQTTTINLIGGLIQLESGFDFETPGMGGTYTYEPYGAQFDFSNFQPHTETFNLVITGAQDAVLAEEDRLQDFLEAVRLFNSGDLPAQSCWLEWSASGEEPKRSLIYAASWRVTSRDNLTPGQLCTVLGTLSLSRHPLFETPSTTTEDCIGGGGGLSNTGGKCDYTDVPGNTLARIARTKILQIVGNNLYRFWVGIRRINQGVTNFEPLWECEDGAIDPGAIGDTAIVVDGTASGGNKVTTTFAADATLQQRFNLSVNDVWTAAGHADYDHAQGRYLILMRCKVVGAGGVAGIQMHSGYTGNVIHEEVYIDNTSWRLIPLGNISIPPWEGSDYGSDVFCRYFRLDIYAEELATCDLDCDCFVLIPNEHMLTIEGRALVGIGAGDSDNVDVKEDDRDLAYWLSPTAVQESLEYALTDWYLPNGDGTIIFAGEDETAHALTDTIWGRFYYYPRWTLYRGE